MPVLPKAFCRRLIAVENTPESGEVPRVQRALAWIVARTWPGGPGWSPTQASHRSVRAHIRAYGSSDDGRHTAELRARTAILGRDVDTWSRVRSLGRISRPRVQHQAPPFGFSFPPPGPAGPVPRLHQYYEGATTSSRPSRRTSFPSFGGTSVALVAFAP